MIICKAIQNIGPEIGETQTAANRLCKGLIGIGPEVGDSDVFILYGSAGAIIYGSAGKIIY